MVRTSASSPSHRQLQCLPRREAQMNNGKERQDQQHHRLEYWTTCLVAWTYYRKEISSSYTLLHRGYLNYSVNRMVMAFTETLDVQHRLFLDFGLGWRSKKYLALSGPRPPAVILGLRPTYPVLSLPAGTLAFCDAAFNPATEATVAGLGVCLYNPDRNAKICIQDISS